MDSIPARPGRSPNEDRKILVGVLHGKGCTMFWCKTDWTPIEEGPNWPRNTATVVWIVVGWWSTWKFKLRRIDSCATQQRCLLKRRRKRWRSREDPCIRMRKRLLLPWPSLLTFTWPQDIRHVATWPPWPNCATVHSAHFLSLAQLPMHCSSVVLVVVLAMLASTAVAQRKTTPPRSVMPWMCLEICNTPDEIQHQLDTILSHKSLLTAVSFEKYSLGAGCNLSGVNVQNLSEVNADIQMAGLEAWPMITSWPHPADFLQRMREVFASEECAQRFISAALDEAKAHNYTGFNLDWEPTAPPNTTLPVTAADATAYASFVDTFAKALHKEGVQLSVDVATWVTVPGGPSIWNYGALAATTVDSAVSMGTYTSSDSTSSSQVSARLGTRQVTQDK